MNKRCLFSFVCGFLLLFAGSVSGARAQDSTISVPELSLNTMILFVLDHNPDVLMAEERQEQMEHFIDEARAAYYPRIELSMEGGREYLKPSAGADLNNLSKTSLVLNQTVFDGFRNREEVRRRKQLRDSAGFDISQKREAVIGDTIKYYLSVLRYQTTVAQTAAFVTQIDKIVANIQQMFDAGAINKAMLDYALSRKASALSDLSEAKSSLNDAVSNLEFLTGKLPPFRATAPDSFQPDRLDMTYYMKLAREQNSELKKNEATQYAMEHQVRAEKGDFFPKVSLKMEAEESFDDGGEIGRQRDLKAVLNMNYKLFDGSRREATVSRVKSQARELEIKNEKIIKELKKQVKLAYNQVLSLQEGIKATRIEIRSGESLRALNAENFRLGSINAIELIEGEERLHTARVKLNKQHQDLYQSVYTLLIKTGLLEEGYFCTTCEDGADDGRR